MMLEKMRAEDAAQAGRNYRPPRPANEPTLDSYDPTDGVMPEVVSERIARRVVAFAGLPIMLGAATFVGFYYATTQLDVSILPQVVAYTTQALLFLSFAGITYGVMSASWDEEVEGSLLGWENVGANVAAMRGSEDVRVSKARRDAEEAEAAEAGIAMGRKGRARAEAARERRDKPT